MKESTREEVKELQLFGDRISAGVIDRLRSQGLDCVGGSYHDVSEYICEAIIQEVDALIKGSDL